MEHVGYEEAAKDSSSPDVRRADFEPPRATVVTTAREAEPVVRGEFWSGLT